MAAKITKQRIEKVLNDLTALSKDLVYEAGLFSGYNVTSLTENVRGCRNSVKTLGQNILSGYYADPEEADANKRVVIQLEKGLTSKDNQLEMLDKAIGCDSVGSKIRSEGKGKGLGRGKGEGPIGRPKKGTVTSDAVEDNPGDDETKKKKMKVRSSMVY